MVIAAVARRAVVATSSGNRGGVERIHGLAVGRLKGQVNARDRPIGFVHPQFVGREVGRPFGKRLYLAKRNKYRAIKALARLEIRNAQVNVIDQPADMLAYFS